MSQSFVRRACRSVLALIVSVALVVGCERMTTRGQNPTVVGNPFAPIGLGPWAGAVPTEKEKTSLPSYVVEPPDILLIDTVKVIPKDPYHIEPLDILQIVVTNTLQDHPITGQFPVDPTGNVELGPAYGQAHVAGLTVTEARDAIDKHLRHILQSPEVSVSLGQPSGQQQIAGDHLVGPDGTVNLGNYGSVYVAGMTLDKVEEVLLAQLSQFLEDPKISVDVLAYNSKVFYIITEGGGFGDTVVRAPITGNETVLDALSLVNGINRVASKNIWIARPAPGGVGCDQVLPVNWNEIVKGGSTATNYQVLPGDRVFIAEDKLIRLDSRIANFLAPFQRVTGFTLLTTQTVQTMNRFPNGYSGGIP